MYQTILLCYDGARESRAALEEGAEIAERLGAEAHLLAVNPPMTGEFVIEAVMSEAVLAERRRVAEAILREGVDCLRQRRLTAEGHLAFGDPAAQIADCARRIGADLVVVGHRPRSGLARWWEASVGQSLMDASPCSVLVALGPKPAASAGGCLETGVS